MLMQYGHCVVRATATAISSLYFTGIAPAATAALSKAQKAFITSGARPSIFFSFARFALSYIGCAILGEVFDPAQDGAIQRRTVVLAASQWVSGQASPVITL